jgi:hypothetical protein
MQDLRLSGRRRPMPLMFEAMTAKMIELWNKNHIAGLYRTDHRDFSLHGRRFRANPQWRHELFCGRTDARAWSREWPPVGPGLTSGAGAL